MKFESVPAAKKMLFNHFLSKGLATPLLCGAELFAQFW